MKVDIEKLPIFLRVVFFLFVFVFLWQRSGECLLQFPVKKNALSKTVFEVMEHIYISGGMVDIIT